MDYFPYSESMPTARPGQIAVITEIDKVFKSGKKLIILEGPVGCGKSAIAITFAKAFADAHMITPRKSLQDQYYADFHNDIVLMKGRAAYPCIYEGGRTKNLIDSIKSGKVKPPKLGEVSCATGPCRDDRVVFKNCMDINGFCPYNAAMETAQENAIVVHNLHSFIFQTSFAVKFEKRSLLAIDEVHDVEDVLREFVIRKHTVNTVITPEVAPQGYDMDDWCNFFLDPAFIPKESAAEERMKVEDDKYQSDRDKYINKVENFRAKKEYYKDNVIVKSTINKIGTKEVSTSFEFIPKSLGNAMQTMLLDMGEHVILMSGTIYGKDIFCKNLGINPADAHYIRIPSTFPAANRPIILKSQYQVDTSFANWNENFREMIEKIETISDIFKDAKGLIHAPSYEAAEQIAHAVKGNRILIHGKSDFQDKLEFFYKSTEPLIFISPVCAQGVDFKEDRARFQIITRVPYSNTSDPFINYQVQNDFSWYNYQALKIFGQQLGRINRSEDDYGMTFCLDSRFNKFITKNLKIIPKWVQNAFVWR